jgi:hypothetical protein
MIRITKGEEPLSLVNNGLNWTVELMGYVQNNMPLPRHIQSRYNQPDVKFSLQNECNSKCMYCESSIGHIAFEHIEHIKPKAVNRYPELTFIWTNLGLVCPICNSNKSDIYDEALPFINPYEDNPLDYLKALGHFIYHLPNNHRGEITVRIINLNRPQLIERRKERIDSIRGLIDRYHAHTNPILKEALKEEILEEIESGKQYSMCCQSIYDAFMN